MSWAVCLWHALSVDADLGGGSPDAEGATYRIDAEGATYRIDAEGATYRIDAEGATYRIERARADDLPAIVALLADDVLGAGRESADPAAYERAFAAIDADPAQFLAVVRSDAGEIVGTCQLTLIPGLARGGATRLSIEAVRTARSERGRGLGAAMFGWAHGYGRRHGAVLAQLTSDKARGEAHRFYERLGYVASHEGFKLSLT